MEHKTQFSQFYEAFGNYSPGGVTEDNVSYLDESTLDHWPNWREIVDSLNSAGVIGADRVEAVPHGVYVTKGVMRF